MAYGRYVFILQPEYGRIAQFLTVFFFFGVQTKVEMYTRTTHLMMIYFSMFIHYIYRIRRT